MKKKPSIAIVGMACVFPGAHTPEELWENILACRRYFRKMPKERMPADEYYDPDIKAAGKTYTDLMAVITGWKFDPIAYRIPPVTYNATDIAHWLALHTADLAFRNAGINLSRIDRKSIGVLLGNSLTGEFSRSHNLRFRWPYVERCLRNALKTLNLKDDELLIRQFKEIYNAPLPEITEDTLAGNMSNTIAGRICNYFDLGGCGFTIDGACSSALLATANACNALANGELKIAVTGGVDVSLDPFEIVGFAKTQALAREDIRPYDKDANGMLTGEGCGILILTKLETAKELDLPIHAVIKGWGYSADGTGGITAPEVEGQKRALRKAYETAGYPITTVGLFEGHGTGTPLGDKVEITSVRELLEEAYKSHSTKEIKRVKIGSIKGNIGHCKAAAGAAGLIKAVMALKHKIIPPTVNCNIPNEAFGSPLAYIEPAIYGGKWEIKPGTKRRASISAMGFGGSNSHITLEEASNKCPAAILRKDLDILSSRRPNEIIFISAETTDELLEKTNNLLNIAQTMCIAELTDLSAILCKQKVDKNNKYRIALVTDTPWDLCEKLNRVKRMLRENIENGKNPEAALEQCNLPKNGIYAKKIKDKPLMVGLFPGQGSQYLNMIADLYHLLPECRHFFEKINKRLQIHTRKKLSDFIFHNEFSLSSEEKKSLQKELSQTHITQPAITAVSLYLAEFLKKVGIEPDICIGHSLGEISSVAVGGGCTSLQAVEIAALRGKAMAELKTKDSGSMLAVFASLEQIDNILHQVKGYAIISNYNSPNQFVVSGESTSIKKIQKLCKDAGIRYVPLKVSHAFHSTITAPAAQRFSEELESIKVSTPKKTVISTALGSQIPRNTDIKKLLAEHIKSPVKFINAIKEADKLNPDIWIEIGPGQVLSNLVKQILPEKNLICLQSAIEGKNTFSLLHHIVAQAFVLGFPVKTEKLFENRFYRDIDISDYKPEFIVNPCEREVNSPANLKTSLYLNSLKPVHDMASNILPEENNSEEFKKYISSRAEFIKEFIRLDFTHFKNSAVKQEGGSDTLAIFSEQKQPEVVEIHAQREKQSNREILNFVIDWISNRTGFPKESILPDMKLRDDLNLDSIKAGELVVTLCKKLNKPSPSDPTVFANVRIDKLIESLGTKEGENEVLSSDSASYTSPSAESSSDFTNLQQRESYWVSTFQMTPMEVPMEKEKFFHLPHEGEILLISNKTELSELLKKNFAKKGLSVSSLSIEEACTYIPNIQKISALLLLLPEEKTPFYEIPEDQFDNYTEKRLLPLFNIFRRFATEKDPEWKNFRSIVISFYNSLKKDYTLDAGKAFLKTCKLEHPGFVPKWLSLPLSENTEKLYEIIETELQYTGNRIFYYYDKNRKRFCEVADIPKPLSQHDKTNELKKVLSSRDVILFTGGGKGITFELAIHFALRYNVKLALSGRSDISEDEELSLNLKKLEQHGIDYIYTKFDICDIAALRKAVTEIEKSKGKITGIVHGAGISQLKLLADMDKDSFVRTLNVKIKGFYNLITAIPIENLKMVHVISSVLGKTGMSGQSDYTLANAWMDGALETLKNLYPQKHYVSAGYSVWKDVGLGKKLGVVDSLKSSGVTPIETRDGIGEYMRLCENTYASSVFIITGSLNPKLELPLFIPCNTRDYRFVSTIRKFVPHIELTTDAEVKYENDFYIPEHLFEGTPMFPAVMMLEGFAEVSSVCIDTNEIPIIKNALFHKPLIISENSPVTLRFSAFKKQPDSASTKDIIIKTELRASPDGFSSVYAEAECIFKAHEDKTIDQLIPCPNLKNKKPLNINPESLSPVPLFQGKFMRRISKIYVTDKENVCITTLNVPNKEKYFLNSTHKIAMPYPVLRDSFLQTGLLILPPGSLPAQLGKLIIYQTAKPESEVICVVKVHEKIEDNEKNEAASGKYRSSLAVYTSSGELAEAMEDVITIMPQGSIHDKKTEPPSPSSMKEMVEEFDALADSYKHALSFVLHEEIKNKPETYPLTEEEIGILRENDSSPHTLSTLANLAAARYCVTQFAEKYGNYKINPLDVMLIHSKNGKPQVKISEDSNSNGLFEDTDISLTDGSGISAAFISEKPVGVDLEIIENRDAEMWLGLLNYDGYNLARNICREISETFDTAATRVWSLLETAKKANNLRRRLPAYTGKLGGSWISFEHITQSHIQEYYSLIVKHPKEKSRFAFTLCMSKSNPNPEKITPDSIAEARETLSRIMSRFKNKMNEFKTEFHDSPDSPETELRHKKFLTEIELFMSELLKIEPKIDENEKYQIRQELLSFFMQFMDGSDVFRHALEKPFGYAGDFLMLDKLVQKESHSKGLAYHFDRSQLEYPASVACRNRIEWVGSELVELAKNKPDRKLKIISIGIGAAPIERYVVKHFPDVKLELNAIDIEPACLEFVKNTLDAPNNRINVYRIDLRRQDAPEEIKKLAVNADVCNFIGIVEALRDEEAVAVLSALFETLPPGCNFYMESFLPDHPTRPYMEWFMDFHLGYRSKEEILTLLEKAGMEKNFISQRTDNTNSLFMIKIIIPG